jgi:hypothetical protein
MDDHVGRLVIDRPVGDGKQTAVGVAQSAFRVTQQFGGVVTLQQRLAFELSVPCGKIIRGNHPGRQTVRDSHICGALDLVKHRRLDRHLCDHGVGANFSGSGFGIERHRN